MENENDIGSNDPTCPKPSEDPIGFCRWIVEHKSYQLDQDEVLIDLFSASLTVQVYDRLSEQNQEKARVMGFKSVAQLAQGCVSVASKSKKE